MMEKTSHDAFGLIESDKNIYDEAFDEHEKNEKELLEICDSQNVASSNMVLTEPSVEGLTVSEDPLEPYTGMTFKSVDDARDFYYAYAKRTGFTIRTNRIRHSQKNREVIARDYVCSREGFRAAKHTLRKDRVLPPRPITREGCKAMIRVALRDEGKWVVTKFVGEHNHKLIIQSKVSEDRPAMNTLSEDEKDKKIQDLSNELQHERQRSAYIQEQLHMILKYLEEHAEYISIRVEDIVNNMKEIEYSGKSF
ncbi:PREDICTED: protein FAR1-RELATED SEQUENCE 5-like [Nelumbo nucifera]|uniref:Protein FAR1-RELATED SEQUENCE 5-like n=2 Tax=Nelumbo nucifera TaxID=4432 RepID=A0A1U8APN1_NELNU|nr:PREDICTED: protein FAR1-RELATED SEQUENCE 5-like [Nelumbo nucifera]XP_010268146.1 PREDICTED: protein FAR1-RELATED SEQUENCE 5-like [Nelumbo nucifera]DAD25254.1 TPA_asm: hypothetical protein HUJ06_026718 [Nelumbo nucifera]